MKTAPKKKANSLSLRFSDEQEAQLREMAKRYRVSKTVIIEWALQALHDYAEAHGGKVALPIDFTEYWQVAQRTKPHSAFQQTAPRDEDIRLNDPPAVYHQKKVGR